MAAPLRLPPRPIVAALNKLQAGLQGLSRRLQPGGVAVFDMVLESFASLAMATAAELGIADKLLPGPLSLADLSQACGVQPEPLYRVMRALSSRGVFRELPGRAFRNTGMSLGLAEIQGSMKYMVISHLNHNVLDLFADLGTCLKTGQSAAQGRFGADVFSHLEKLPIEHEQFVRAMDNTSALAAPVIVAGFPFARYKKIIDLGGGLGRMLATILEYAPASHGVLFDRPDTIAKAQTALSGHSAQNRISMVGGDFFRDQLPSGDLYFLKNVLHDWDDAACVSILRNIRRSMDEGGRVVAVDFVLSKPNQAHTGKLSDLLMLVGLDGARERSADEFKALFAQAGFKLARIRPTIAPFSVLEAQAL